MFEITLLNAEFGQVLNAEGDLQVSGKEEFCPKFELIGDALIEKDRLLKKYVYTFVIIKDIGCGGGSQEYYNEDLGLKFNQEKLEYYKWIHLPIYKHIFTKKPVFKYYDGKY